MIRAIEMKRGLQLIPVVAMLWLSSALAEVVGVDVATREVIEGGRDFGAAGQYERIEGTITFALDPDHRFNERIVDLDLAPRNDEGMVTATATLIVLQAVDPEKRSGAGLLEVSNRGGRASLRYFQLANDPGAEDSLLMDRGVTIIWVGWQWDIIPEPGRMTIEIPIATGENDEVITGLVRADWTVDADSDELNLAHRDRHRPYAVHDPDSGNHRLTVREGRDSLRVEVPRSEWGFSEDGTQLVMQNGFRAGRIYELVYEGSDPAVVGMGFAAIRDTMSYAKYDEDSLFPVEHGVAVGISQTGRFLRMFTYQGFNTDTEGRQVFDGMMILTAGAGRGSFNHRFAQPSRDGHRYSAFFYPTDIFPFTSLQQEDAFTGRFDGLFAHQHDANHIPRVFFINTGYEYWGRSAALIHTSVDGQRDFSPSDRERIYHLSSTMHYRGNFENNPIDLYLVYRAIMVAMLDWAQDIQKPPPSNYPRISDGSLVSVDQIREPGIPDLKWPKIAQTAYRADYGAQWSEGIITMQPPELGPEFASLVPQVDGAGNEISGIKPLEVRVPLGTFLPWSLRNGMAGGNGELVDFVGGFRAFPITESARRETADPRPSIEQLYENREQFEARLREVADEMVSERTLLPNDVERAIERNLDIWDHVHSASDGE